MNEFKAISFDMAQMNNSKVLNVFHCERLTELLGLGLLKSLTELEHRNSVGDFIMHGYETQTQQLMHVVVMHGHVCQYAAPPQRRQPRRHGLLDWLDHGDRKRFQNMVQTCRAINGEHYNREVPWRGLPDFSHKPLLREFRSIISDVLASAVFVTWPIQSKASDDFATTKLDATWLKHLRPEPCYGKASCSHDLTTQAVAKEVARIPPPNPTDCEISIQRLSRAPGLINVYWAAYDSGGRADAITAGAADVTQAAVEWNENSNSSDTRVQRQGDQVRGPHVSCRGNYPSSPGCTPPASEAHNLIDNKSDIQAALGCAPPASRSPLFD
eukprot:Gb_18438 [translate_table: standard]